MMRLSVAAPGAHLLARTLAADLAAATLQNQRARSYLNYEPPAASSLPINELPVLQEYYCSALSWLWMSRRITAGGMSCPIPLDHCPISRATWPSRHTLPASKRPADSGCDSACSFEAAQKSNLLSLPHCALRRRLPWLA